MVIGIKSVDIIAEEERMAEEKRRRAASAPIIQEALKDIDVMTEGGRFPADAPSQSSEFAKQLGSDILTAEENVPTPELEIGQELVENLSIETLQSLGTGEPVKDPQEAEAAKRRELISGGIVHAVSREESTKAGAFHAGNMAKLAARKANPHISRTELDTVKNVANALHVAGRGGDAPQISPEDLRVYRDITSRPSRTITNLTRDQGYKNTRIKERLDSEIKSSSLKVSDAIAKNPDITYDEFQNVVSESFPGYLQDIGRIESAKLLTKDLVDDANVRQANESAFEKWMGKNPDGNYAEFDSEARAGLASGSPTVETLGAWVKSPDGKFVMVTESTAVQKAKAEAEAKARVDIELGSGEPIDLTNKDHIVAAKKYGLTEAAIRIDQDKSEVIAPPVGSVAVQVSPAFSVPAIAAQAAAIVAKSVTTDLNTAIKRAVNAEVGRPGSTVTVGSAENIYKIYGEKIKDSIKKTNGENIEVARVETQRGKGRQLGSVLDRLGVVNSNGYVAANPNTFPNLSPTEQMAFVQSLRADGIDPDSPDAASDYVIGISGAPEGSYPRERLEAMKDSSSQRMQGEWAKFDAAITKVQRDIDLGLSGIDFAGEEATRIKFKEDKKRQFIIADESNQGFHVKFEEDGSYVRFSKDSKGQKNMKEWEELEGDPVKRKAKEVEQAAHDKDRATASVGAQQDVSMINRGRIAISSIAENGKIRGKLTLEPGSVELKDRKVFQYVPANEKTTETDWDMYENYIITRYGRYEDINSEVIDAFESAKKRWRVKFFPKKKKARFSPARGPFFSLIPEREEVASAPTAESLGPPPEGRVWILNPESGKPIDIPNDKIDLYVKAGGELL